MILPLVRCDSTVPGVSNPGTTKVNLAGVPFPRISKSRQHYVLYRQELTRNRSSRTYLLICILYQEFVPTMPALKCRLLISSFTTALINQTKRHMSTSYIGTSGSTKQFKPEPNTCITLSGECIPYPKGRENPLTLPISRHGIDAVSLSDEESEADHLYNDAKVWYLAKRQALMSSEYGKFVVRVLLMVSL